MYIGMRQKRRFAIFMGFLFFISAIVSVSFLLQREVSEEFLKLSEPRNVVLSNVFEDSVTVTWVTDTKINGSLVVYDSDEERIGEFEDERNIGRSYTHYIEITGLSSGNSYEFEIALFDGKKYEFSTREVLADSFAPNVLEGSIDFEDVLVFLLVDDLVPNYPLSSFVVDGQWSFDVSDVTFSGNREAFDFRSDTPLKLLFYSKDGVKVIQGNRNVLFTRDGEFDGVVKLDGSENVFSYIPDFARFRGDFVEIQDIATDIENESVSEEILGVEEEELNREGQGSLQRLENLSDYGFYE